MKKIVLGFFSLCTVAASHAQQPMTIETLLQLGRVNPMGITKDGKSILYSVKKYNFKEGKSNTLHYLIPVEGGQAVETSLKEGLLMNDRMASDGKHSLSAHEVKLKSVFGKDVYPTLTQSDVMMYDHLNYRHWDTWEDGSFGHVFVNTVVDGKVTDSVDIMQGELVDCPQKPFGGNEDFIWNPNGKEVLYVTKKKFGNDYALSTNTDIYSYNLETKITSNLTQGMMGYDVHPSFSTTGTLAFLSMKTDGYESDKNDIVVHTSAGKNNLTQQWDGTVTDFKWSSDGKKIFFTAPTNGTVQLFEVAYDANTHKGGNVKQLTKGDFDVQRIVGESNHNMIITRTDMNHAAEIYSVDLSSGTMKQITHVNDETYRGILFSKIEGKYISTTDGQKMFTWIIYPPNFDPAKKYPTLLYCQGGPQAQVSQFYSTRWNFQLMAANGYIVVAPNRRGLPGFGVKWNEQISGDYGGQNMKDYLSAIDELAKQPYVDKNRLGCVGASYGGFSVYYLAGIHEKRFKSFIAHDGIFDWRSMYGTTEELFFTNYDLKGAYWEDKNTAAKKAYHEFNPVNYVQKWDTPILIIQGGKDYRVPIEQGLGAFQAAQLRGIKSKLLYFPNENHWILSEQNAFVWQSEFFKWLSETLKQ
jgi:dipeptidyl aminopeptidase/acylaminoacyl peptidase